ncbi:hypothetical protein X777_13070 [Ooceraea biroi]|uniref:Uncharacterized protein n=1 Tax=Ooceraea biroi TaxID=2015173 RepID=A0A026WYF0_OOCBI|nr:hypothetical protein X777_13070 [Ooceraea biroi]
MSTLLFGNSARTTKLGHVEPALVNGVSCTDSRGIPEDVYRPVGRLSHEAANGLHSDVRQFLRMPGVSYRPK